MRDKGVQPGAYVAIQVDYQRMRGLAFRLRELARQLGGHSGFVQSAALDQDLSGRLSRVENDWIRHRSRLQSFLAETATGVDRIVAQYEKTNDTVASAATRR